MMVSDGVAEVIYNVVVATVALFMRSPFCNWSCSGNRRSILRINHVRFWRGVQTSG
jgi:hypothetical protein